ncbi:hypothetical protein BDN71DRAFT_1428279 [Pleurotus eryngii]|uniref:Transmembrane protein n=1 Tax=Pleurotus eryngii TaxID=5323 RepID=A0A9P6A4T5_PLEER|nr:hypothetical protein BDN71DRAFT_1428279 [Pleurotus eryngii]
MPSFGLLTAFASLALATFTSAAPAPGGDHHHEFSLAEVEAVVDAVVKNVNVANVNQARRDLADVDAAALVGAKNINALNVHQARGDIVDIEAVVRAVLQNINVANVNQARGEDVADVTAVVTAVLEKINVLNFNQARSDVIDIDALAAIILKHINILNFTQSRRDLVDIDALVEAIVSEVNVLNFNQSRQVGDAVSLDSVLEGLALAKRDGHNIDLADAAAIVAATLSSANLGNVNQGRGEPRSLPAILIDVTAKVTPACQKLGALVDVDISVEVVGGICKEISSVLVEATAEVKLLVGLPLDKILFLSGKVLALVDVAKLVADLLCLVLGALAACLKLVAAAKVGVIFPLLSAVGILVCDLVATIFIAVNGLLPLVLGLICKIVPALFRLKLWAFVDVLGL